MTEHPLSRNPSEPPLGPSSRAGTPAHPPEYGPMSPWQEREEETFDWRRYASALVRHKWIVALAALLGAGGAFLSWDQHVEGRYVAYGSLWVNQGGGNDVGPILTDGLLPASSWVDLLRSFSVLDTVVVQQKLYVRPGEPGALPLFETFELTEGVVPGSYNLEVSENGRALTLYRDRIVVDQATMGNPIGAAQGWSWVPPPEALRPGQEVPFAVVTPRQAAQELQGEIEAQLDPQRVFIRIELRGPDPQRLVAVVDGLMERHVELAAELKSAHLDEQTEVLAQQLRQVEEELAAAERSLEAFRIGTVTLPSDEPRAYEPGLEMTRGPVFDDFFRMRVEQDQLRRDRQRLEAVLETLPESGFPVEAVELIPSVLNSSQLREALATLAAARSEQRTLLERYTLEHPPVRDVTDRIRRFETTILPSLMQQLAAQLRQEEEVLGARIEASGQSLGEIPPRSIEEARLRRRVAIAERLYGDLRSRYEISSLARRSSIPDVRVLDRAIAYQVPQGDRRVRVAALLFAGLLGAGLAGALLADRLDPRLRSPDEISIGMGLPVLGTVPRLRSPDGAEGVPTSQEAREAFREIRTNLTYAYGSAGPTVLTISSAGSGEGKTLITASLGVSFAELGRRTLVVDADTRRGDLHEQLGCRRRPGLTDLLRSTVSWDEVVQDTDHEGLHFVGSGRQVGNSPELLSSGSMGSLLSELRRDYDVILIDSPPFGVGADSLVLSCLAGHLLLVMRSGTTHREFLQSKLDSLARLPVRLVGAVLNDFQPERLSAYYGSYLPGYEAGREETDPAPAV